MTNGYPEWLVMVYISADGLLANFAVESLKQLKRAAGNGVVVVAQVDKDGDIPARKYVFDKSGSLADSKAQILDLPTGGTPDPKNLTEFINHAVGTYGQDKRRALFLWGHGPELLFDEDPAPKAGGSARKPIRKYLTPSELKTALKDTNLVNAEHKLDIIGLDACSMSMVEVASELGDCAEFMIASQEDVPDTSFPYADILSFLKQPGSAEDAARKIPELYLNTYRDYVTAPSTGFRGITISAVRLSKIDSVVKQLRNLANALLEGSKDKTARQAIFESRKKAHGFVFGLYVDIVDLCRELEASKIGETMKAVCDPMREAVAAVMIENKAFTNQPDDTGIKTEDLDSKGLAKGLSIYFPYRVADATEELQEFRAAKGSRTNPSKEGRAARIRDLEEDFSKLKLNDWKNFIQQGWCSILAQEAQQNKDFVLDEVYSAQQCAQNLGSLGHGAEPPRKYEVRPRATARPIPREEPAA
jgi:hypothetical protein